MRAIRHRDATLFLGFLGVLLLSLALSFVLPGCATVDATNPVPGQAQQFTTEQQLSLVRGQLSRAAYDIEVAHRDGIIGDETYGQLRLRYTQAAKVFNGVLAGTRPRGDLDQVDSMLSAIQRLLVPVAKGGTP